MPGQYNARLEDEAANNIRYGQSLRGVPRGGLRDRSQSLRQRERPHLLCGVEG